MINTKTILHKIKCLKKSLKKLVQRVEILENNTGGGPSTPVPFQSLDLSGFPFSGGTVEYRVVDNFAHIRFRNFRTGAIGPANVVNLPAAVRPPEDVYLLGYDDTNFSQESYFIIQANGDIIQPDENFYLDTDHIYPII